MELFMDYFIPALCLILIGTIPLYLVRIFMYFRRKHFMLQMESVKISMYAYGVLYLAFIITFLFSIKKLSDMRIAWFVMIFIGILLISLFFGYRYIHLHTKRNRFNVVFSRWNNRIEWQKLLDDQKLVKVDIDEGGFSFVSKINFTGMNQKEIDELFKSFEKETTLLVPLNDRKALLLLAFQVFMLSISMVSFVLFFVLISIL